jgi:hypothetical protein
VGVITPEHHAVLAAESQRLSIFKQYGQGCA